MNIAKVALRLCLFFTFYRGSSDEEIETHVYLIHDLVLELEQLARIRILLQSSFDCTTVHRKNYSGGNGIHNLFPFQCVFGEHFRFGCNVCNLRKKILLNSLSAGKVQ